MYKILMLCTGNICRSPIAAGLLRHYLPNEFKPHVDVASAGTHAIEGNRAEAHAIEAMARIGINISAHRASQITKPIARQTDLLLTMEASHVRWLKSLLRWRQNKPQIISEFNPDTPNHDITDPYGGTLNDFETCIRTLTPCIEGVVRWLRHRMT